MNNDVNQRFAVTAEIVFTSQQEMDEFDAQQFFELELSEHWEGLHDLDFVPADPDEYEDYKRENRLQSSGR